MKILRFVMILGTVCGSNLSAGEAKAVPPPPPVATNYSAQPSPPVNVTVTLAAPTNQVDAAALESQIEELQKKTDESYPTMLEKQSSDIATLGTYLTIILTVATLIAAIAGTIYVINYFKKAKKEILEAANGNARDIGMELNLYLKGITNMTQGMICAHAAWDKNNNYAQTPLVHLSSDAVEYTRLALKQFNDLKDTDKGRLFKSQTEENRLRSTNNLIFYTALAGEIPNEIDIVKLAQDLRSSKDFEKNPHRANTYILALIVFRQTFALTLNESPAAVAAKIDREFALQRSRKLSPFDQKEIEWLWTKFTS